MRELTNDEKQAVLGLVDGVGLAAIVETVRESHQTRADQLEMEASLTYDSNKMVEAELEKAEASKLSFIIGLLTGESQVVVITEAAS